MKQLLSVLALLSTACIDSLGKDSGQTSDGLEASVTWNANSVTLEITGGDIDASYSWGIVETGATCEYGSGDCWTGEDCLDGYTIGSGTTYSYCHPLDDNSITLEYGASPEGLTEGQSTAFGNSDFDGSVTYILEDVASGVCYVWGHDTTYYSGIGCDAN